MQATRFWVPACLAVFASALSFNCGSDEASTPGAPACVGDCGSELPVGGESFAGGPSFNVGGSGSGNGAMPVGGDAGAPFGGFGAVGGDAGNGSTGVAGSGAGGAFGGAGGAPTNPGGEQLEVCGRLTMIAVHDDAVARAYAKAVYADCQVHWVAALQGDDLVNFRNDLVTWNFAFWGCAGALPVESFALVFGTPPLTQGDVEVLIDHYMTAAQDDLDLSPPEATEMRAALERLAAPLVTDPSPDVSNSVCTTGAGGAGGAGGAAPGAGGAATAPGGAGAGAGGAP